MPWDDFSVYVNTTQVGALHDILGALVRPDPCGYDPRQRGTRQRACVSVSVDGSLFSPGPVAAVAPEHPPEAAVDGQGVAALPVDANLRVIPGAPCALHLCTFARILCTEAAAARPPAMRCPPHTAALRHSISGV